MLLWVRYVRYYDARRICYRTLTQHPLSGYPPDFVRNHKVYESAQVVREIHDVLGAVTAPCMRFVNTLQKIC